MPGSKPNKGKRIQCIQVIGHKFCPPFFYTVCSSSSLPIQWYTGIQKFVEFILPEKGCRGTAGFWHSKRHTTGGGMERPGGSQCPGAQAPGGTGVHGKGKASGGRLSSRGAREFSCKGRGHRLELGTRLGKEWVCSRMRVGPQISELGGL